MPSKRFRLFSHAIAWASVLLLLAFGVPRVELIFTDFGIPLPRLTTLIIRASHLRTVILPLVLVLAGTDWYVFESLSKQGNDKGAWSWSAAIIAAPLALIAITLAALVLPLLTIDHLSG